MAEAWFTDVADELAQCLLDARACAAACETLLESAPALVGADGASRLLAALVAPAAISQILIELIDGPPQLVLAAAQVCRETALQATAELGRLGLPLDAAAATAALEAAAAAAARLLEAAGH